MCHILKAANSRKEDNSGMARNQKRIKNIVEKWFEILGQIIGRIADGDVGKV
jgi:hypothetical protein